jgi:hypothetical protein
MLLLKEWPKNIQLVMSKGRSVCDQKLYTDITFPYAKEISSSYSSANSRRRN